VAGLHLHSKHLLAYLDVYVFLAAFEMGRVSAFLLESRIVLDSKEADSAFFLTR
jgi:hypothetical protein